MKLGQRDIVPLLVALVGLVGCDQADSGNASLEELQMQFRNACWSQIIEQDPGVVSQIKNLSTTKERTTAFRNIVEEGEGSFCQARELLSQAVDACHRSVNNDVPDLIQMLRRINDELGGIVIECRNGEPKLQLLPIEAIPKINPDDLNYSFTAQYMRMLPKQYQ